MMGKKLKRYSIALMFVIKSVVRSRSQCMFTNACNKYKHTHYMNTFKNLHIHTRALTFTQPNSNTYVCMDVRTHSTSAFLRTIEINIFFPLHSMNV